MSKRIYKFNGGKGAVLCSGCSVMVREGNEITNEEVEDMQGRLTEKLKAFFCYDCKKTLLAAYMFGWINELNNSGKHLKQRLIDQAINIGSLDAILGDDNPKIDYQTEDEILENIYSTTYMHK